MNPRRVVLAVVVGLVAALSISWASGDEAAPVTTTSTSTTLAPVERVRWPELDVETVQVTGTRDGMTGVMAHRAMAQAPRQSGPSGDQLRIVFPKPARIHGIAISVDLGFDEVTVVEVDAGLNATHPYGMEADLGSEVESQPYQQGNVAWLLHTSATDGRDIDEQVMFPQPIDVIAGEFVTLSGWVRNVSTTEQIVHPEVIVYYEWT